MEKSQHHSYPQKGETNYLKDDDRLYPHSPGGAAHKVYLIHLGYAWVNIWGGVL